MAVHEIPDGGVEPDGIFVRTKIIVFSGVRSACHKLSNVDSGYGHGKKPHSAENGVPASYAGRDGEGLPALFRCHLAQGTLDGVGDGIDALPGTVGAVFALQHPAQGPGGHSGLGGGTGFGDDGDGKILPVQQPAQLVPVTGAQAVARVKDLGVALAPAQVAVGTLEQLNGGPGAKVGAANADDHKHIAGGTYLFRGGLNSGELGGYFPGGQLHPAQVFLAGTAAVGQGSMGGGHFLLNGHQISEFNTSPNIGNVDFHHKRNTSFPCGSFANLFYSKRTASASPDS